MLTPEETKVLCHLQRHPSSSLTDVLQRCFPDAPTDWGNRVISNLEWLNNLTVFYSRQGEPLAVQITEKGLALAQTLRARVAN